MNVLSLFDGISCGRVALERAGISVNEYHASEINKYAIAISDKNYPDIIRHGDVNGIDFRVFERKIDLLIGGSPCTDLSIAKRGRKGLAGEQSKLFYRFVEALKIIKPRYFLLENVASMNKEDRELITKSLDVEPIMINSSLVSAQSRKRLYWCNWKNKQPENKSTIIKDILESGEAYSDKSKCLTTYYGKSCFPSDFLKARREMVAERIIQRPHGFNRGGVYLDKAPSITSNGCWEHNNLVVKPIRLATIGKSGQGCRVYTVKDKSLTLSGMAGGHARNTELYKIDLPDGEYTIRKLTPVECERLQTLPDNYTDGVSNTQRYKAIGNAWTVDVVAHILKSVRNKSND